MNAFYPADPGVDVPVVTPLETGVDPRLLQAAAGAPPRPSKTSSAAMAPPRPSTTSSAAMDPFGLFPQGAFQEPAVGSSTLGAASEEDSYDLLLKDFTEANQRRTKLVAERTRDERKNAIEEMLREEPTKRPPKSSFAHGRNNAVNDMLAEEPTKPPAKKKPPPFHGNKKNRKPPPFYGNNNPKPPPSYAVGAGAIDNNDEDEPMMDMQMTWPRAAAWQHTETAPGARG